MPYAEGNRGASKVKARSLFQALVAHGGQTRPQHRFSEEENDLAGFRRWVHIASPTLNHQPYIFTDGPPAMSSTSMGTRYFPARHSSWQAVSSCASSGAKTTRRCKAVHAWWGWRQCQLSLHSFRHLLTTHIVPGTCVIYEIVRSARDML